MTESEWLNSTNSTPMVEYLRGMATRRKLRLFACTCCRNVWHRLNDSRGRLAVEIAEWFAEGEATEEDRRSARHGAQVARGSAPNDHSVRALIRAAYETTNPDAGVAAAYSSGYIEPYIEADELRCHVQLLRDIFGNPFRPVVFSDEWRTSTVVALASQMYESRDFSAMPILADALQDAGCDSDDMLNHCQGNGPHCRGCWVVDLVLGKE